MELLEKFERENLKLNDKIESLEKANDILQRRCSRLEAVIAKHEAENKRLKAIERAAAIFVTDSYRPEPKYDAMRFDDLKELLGEPDEK